MPKGPKYLEMEGRASSSEMADEFDDAFRIAKNRRRRRPTQSLTGLIWIGALNLVQKQNKNTTKTKQNKHVRQSGKFIFAFAKPAENDPTSSTASLNLSEPFILGN